MANKKKGSKSRQVSFASKKQSKAKYRIRNWSAYNASLVKRGSITLWINTADLNTWKPDGPRQRGGQWVYSDAAIQCLWLLRSVFHLTLRATEGFAHSLFQLMGVDLPVPDYSTICRRANGLTVRLPKNAKGPLHVVLDSSGLKIFGEGEWKVRQYGYSKRRTWRKLHLAVDSQTGEVQAVILSEASMDDAAAVPQMLEQITEPMEQLSADGAYDKRKVYKSCTQHGIDRVVIPPRKDARIWQPGNCKAPPHPRDENLRRIRQVGRQQWKQESSYHQRSLAETTLFRFKTIFGAELSARTMPQQITEAQVKCAALNRMTHLGMPDSYRVAA